MIRCEACSLPPFISGAEESNATATHASDNPRLMASPTPTLHIAPSGIHGLGAFVTTDLPAGALLGTYDGRRFTPEQLLERDWDHQVTYLFSMSNGNTIDGGRGGNATRHINHSCLPNCEAAEEFGARGRLVVRIYTLVPLRAGEEAFLDYGLIIDEADSPADYPCCCGAPGCRGTMVATAPAAEESHLTSAH
jgi:SET domain-containing protein